VTLSPQTERPRSGRLQGFSRDQHPRERLLVLRTSHSLGPVIEEVDELGALTFGKAAHGLRLADPALVQEAGRLDPPELGNGHQHVEHLRRRDELGRVEEDALDVRLAGLQVSLQLSPLDANVIRPLKRLHSLIERARGRLGVRLRDHEPHESSKIASRVKRERFAGFAGIFKLSEKKTKRKALPT
jgi:hypothetical protein